jgi:hypothetical protein
MTKDIEETRLMNAKKKQVEEAIEELKELMGKKDVHIGISALISYLCLLSWHSNYPLEKIAGAMASIYAQYVERDNASDT